MASVIRGSGASTLGGALDVQGVLTYEDVTSVDSIGIITARSGIIVGTGASIFSPDTNELTLGTNNVERLRIESGGNITATSRVDVGGLTADSNLTPTSGTSIEIFYGGSGGVIQTFDRDNSNTEPLRVRGSNWDIGYNGSASFAGGAFAIESDGDISTNVRGHGHIELDSTGAFTSPKIKLFANTGAATFVGDVICANDKIKLVTSSAHGLIQVKNSSGTVTANIIGSTGGGTFAGEGSFGSYIASTRFTVNGALSSNVNGVNYPFAAYDGSSNLYASINESGAATFNGVCKVDRTVSGDGCFHAALNGTVKASITSAGVATFAGSVIHGSLAPGGGGGNYLSVGEVAAYSPAAGNHVWRAWNASSSPNVLTSQIYANGNAIFAGSVSKGSGSFRIDHPLPAKTETHHLVHSFIEGPQADLIYRGYVDLVDGQATVNIDTAGRMTEGTFAALCTNVSCFTSNESDWTAVKGSVTGNILTITAQDNTSTAKVSWMVVGERKDQHMIDTDWTDSNGRVITEPSKESS